MIVTNLAPLSLYVFDGIPDWTVSVLDPFFLYVVEVYPEYDAVIVAPFGISSEKFPLESVIVPVLPCLYTTEAPAIGSPVESTTTPFNTTFSLLSTIILFTTSSTTSKSLTLATASKLLPKIIAALSGINIIYLAIPIRVERFLFIIRIRFLRCNILKLLYK